MTEILDIELIKKRATSGIVTLTLRTFLLQAFTSFISLIILPVLLDPNIFGIFFIVSALINLLAYFSDIGLAAALIQKKGDISKSALATTFSIQQGIILVLVLIGLASSAKIANFYHLDADGLLLVRVLIFSLILSSLKTIPSILLERKLKFTLLVIPQIAENIVFYSIVTFLAYLNFGIASFTWAVLARGVVGLILIYILSPYVPRIGFNKIIAKKLTAFGVPFQINSILALIKDDLLTIFLGKVLTFSEVGYLGLAQKAAATPLRFFLDTVNKVTFPAYSRLQQHNEELAKAIEKSLFFVTYFVYPSIFGLVAIAPAAINIIPRFGKWEPALPLLYLFACNTIFSAISTTFTNALFAVGRPKIVLYFMVFWTGATWLLTYYLVTIVGYLGVAIASAIVAFSSVGTIYFVRRQIPITIGKNILGPFSISILMFLSIKLLQFTLEENVSTLILTIIAGAIIYFAASLVVFKKQLIEDAMTIINSVIFKK